MSVQTPVVPPPSAAGDPASDDALQRQIGRRAMLRGLGLAGATIVVAGAGGLSYRVFDNGVLDSGSGDPYEAWTHWRSDATLTGAVGAAILAANPHNTQPWIFEITDTTVDVFTDQSRRMPETDPFGREHHVGIGCALENLVLAARARGLEPAVTLLPTAGDPLHLAHVTTTTRPAASSSLHEAIGSRHSNRGPYTSTPLAEATLAGFSDLAADLSGLTVRWLTTDSEKAALGALMLDAAQAVVDDERSSAEGFGWFRNDRDDIDRFRDGLTLDGQGMTDTTLALGKILPASSRVAGDQFWLEQTRSVHTATAAAYGVLLAADPSDVRTRLAGGRLLQRTHLSATAEGLGLQHMNQITERIGRERSIGVAATFAPRFDALIGEPGLAGLCAFRAGHPVGLGRPSPRRTLAAVIR
ncbi:hypothetical protein ABLG96_10870 [Nakamurella sp. A5-74]|uniref:Tat pathway signal protein n=1 Tax=Nakamurella sp. A5-74 TaxID=3158264 RepID=A0AAU8DVI3_9ACTN